MSALPKIKNSDDRKMTDRFTIQLFDFNGAIKEEDND